MRLVATFAVLLLAGASWGGDSWDRPVELKSGDRGYPWVAPIHVTLLPDGETVLIIGAARNTPVNLGLWRDFAGLMTITPIGPTPDHVDVSEVLPDYEFPPTDVDGDTFFCSCHTLLANGDFFVAGGGRLTSRDASLTGLPYANVYDGKTFRRTTYMEAGQGDADASIPDDGRGTRFYPACTRLQDGRVLVTGGGSLVGWYQNRSTEVFDPDVFDPEEPANDPWTLIGSHDGVPPDAPPEIFNVEYSHVFQLPAVVQDDHDLLILGEMGVPVLHTVARRDSWLVREPRPSRDSGPSPDPNAGASTVLLPIGLASNNYNSGSILTVGGNHDTDAVDSADVYDPFDRYDAKDPADVACDDEGLGNWRFSTELGTRRHHPSTVLLPDGRVLVVGGYDEDCPPEDPDRCGTLHAQLIDALAPPGVVGGKTCPSLVFEEGTSNGHVVRAYHNVALLLPDGRVLVGGGFPGEEFVGAEATTFEYYSPPYLTATSRPQIDAANPVMPYGTHYSVEWSGSTPVHGVLIGLGSMTHSIDFNQRYVRLRAIVEPGRLRLKTPPNTRAAPPGHYMLFLVDGNRVPSVAKIVRLPGHL